MKQEYLNSVNLKSQSAFPYLVMDVTKERSLPKPPGFNVLHWHADFQFILVLSGNVFVHTLNQTTIVHTGESIFINKNVVHLILGTDDCHYKSFVFPENFVTFFPGYPTKKYIEGISENKQLSTYLFKNDTPWCLEITELLNELEHLEKRPSDVYEYEVLVTLSRIWLILLKKLPLTPNPVENEISKRMRLFLEFIAAHYGEDISLEDLAKSADVSKSECLRCFKLSLQTTPYNYLIEYRLSKAEELLRTTNEFIGDISNAVGFGQASHFSKCFKDQTGISPKEYRKKQKSETK